MSSSRRSHHSCNWSDDTNQSCREQGTPVPGKWSGRCEDSVGTRLVCLSRSVQASGWSPVNKGVRGVGDQQGLG